MLDDVTEAVHPALKAFVRTLLLGLACGAALAVLCALVASRGWFVRGMLGALVAFALAFPAATYVAWLAAIAAGAVAVLTKAGVGSRIVCHLFDATADAPSSMLPYARDVYEAASTWTPTGAAGPLGKAIELHVVKSAARWMVSEIPPRDTGDVAALRASLAERADAAVASRAGGALRGSARWVAGLVVVVALAAAWALRAYT